MSYLVITPDGTSRREDGTPTLDQIDAIVGPSGWARVHVYPDRRMARWGADCGLIDGSPRHIVGASQPSPRGPGRGGRR